MRVRDRAIEVLRTDVVITAGQLSRLYGVERRVLTGLPHRTLTVSPVHMRPGLVVDATFYALGQRTLDRLSPGNLSHLAGTAEIRAVLRVPPDRYRVLPRARGVQRPDAEYHDPLGGVIAVEYDSGTYSRGDVAAKLECYRQHYDGTVWAVCSAVRLERFKRRYLQVQLMQVSWWASEPLSHAPRQSRLSP